MPTNTLDPIIEISRAPLVFGSMNNSKLTVRKREVHRMPERPPADPGGGVGLGVGVGVGVGLDGGGVGEVMQVEGCLFAFGGIFALISK